MNLRKQLFLILRAKDQQFHLPNKQTLQNANQTCSRKPKKKEREIKVMKKEGYF